MATSKPATDTAPKRSPNQKPRTPPAMPAITTVRKPETTSTRRNIGAPVPLSPSSTKRSTAISSKPVTTSNTSRVISPKPKKNPSLAVAPSKDRIHGTKIHKDGVLSPKPPSPKPRTESATTRAGTGVRTSARVVDASAPVRGRSPVTGTKTVSKVGAAAAAAKPASKRSPSVGAKTGTRGSLTRVNSAPNLLKEAANVHEEKATNVPVEEEKITYVSPDIENKDEQTEPVPVPVPSSMEEQVKEEHNVDVRIENDGQSETYAENDVHEDEEEPTDEVTSEPATAELVPIQTVPVPDVSVPEVPIPDAPVPVVPVPAAQVAPAAATVMTAHGKKEAGTSNAAIEETRSKLIRERKSKVLALVGAFESVM